MDRITLSQLEVDCIIGIFDWERKRKQKVLIDLEMPCDARRAAKSDHINDTLDYKKISKSVLSLVQKSKFQLIETLAEAIAREILTISHIPSITVRVSKPGAVRYSQNVSVCITRHQEKILAYVSIGSNMNQKQMIPRSVESLEDEFGKVQTSRVYQSEAVGNGKQAAYWNQMIRLSTNFSLPKLKRKLRLIEEALGRKRTQDKYAPRVIDLDVVFYGNQAVDDEDDLVYVLLPMAEIAPNFIHPRHKKTILELVAQRYDPKARFQGISFN